MNSLAISFLALAGILAGAAVGSFAHRRLPKKYLRQETRDSVKAAAAIIATLSALVAGLLIASTKSAYDAQEAQIKQISANIVLLDQILEQFGADATQARVDLRGSVKALADRIWNSAAAKGDANSAFEITPEAKIFLTSFQALAPKTDAQRHLYGRALESLTAVGQARIMLFAQSRDQLAPPFVAILIFWLSIVFASFTLFVKADALFIGAIVLAAFACSAAIFLILEMNDPLTGLMSISRTPFEQMLRPIPR